MALTAQQRSALERRLPVHRNDGRADEPVQVTITPRKFAVLVEALAHYRDTACPLTGQNDQCDALFWYEAAQGHLERSCEHICDQLIDDLIGQVPEDPR